MGLSQIVPELDLRHLKTLTDDVGLTQHAFYAAPDRRHGYCTDDNARSLVVALRYLELRDGPEVWRLIWTYLAFLLHAYNEDRGRFRNFMSYARDWLEEVGSDDCHARAIMALGTGASVLRDDSSRGLCARLFCDALPAAEGFEPSRAMAYTIVGIDAYLKHAPDDSAAWSTLRLLAGRLMRKFDEHSSPDWPWLEEALTWGNARVAQGLLLAADRLNWARMRQTGLRTLRWLLDIQTAEAGYLTIIGNKGWYPRGGTRAEFDQQPIEAMCLAEACNAAYAATRDEAWLVEIRRCLEWFLGRNSLGIALYDSSTGGGRDGLTAGGVNVNQGAESTLAWLTTLLLVHKLRASETFDFTPQLEGPLELQHRVV